MWKWCLHASLFIFDRIIIKVAGNHDRHKSLVKFDFGPNQTTHFGVTCPWMTKILHFWTWIFLEPVGQSWSNFMCSIIGVGERLHKVLGQVDLAHWTQVSDHCPLGYLLGGGEKLGWPILSPPWQGKASTLCRWLSGWRKTRLVHSFSPLTNESINFTLSWIQIKPLLFKGWGKTGLVHSFSTLTR